MAPLERRQRRPGRRLGVFANAALDFCKHLLTLESGCRGVGEGAGGELLSHLRDQSAAYFESFCYNFQTDLQKGFTQTHSTWHPRIPQTADKGRFSSMPAWEGKIPSSCLSVSFELTSLTIFDWIWCLFFFSSLFVPVATWATVLLIFLLIIVANIFKCQ